MNKNEKRYKLTTVSCFVGIFVQAIVTNLTAILFIPLRTLYGLSYIHLGILVAVNFTAQVAADLIFSGAIDRIGFRRITLPTTALACFGLILLGLTPFLFANNIFAGLLIATVVFAMASGLLEILMSPIVDALPSDNKEGAMSLMHSFYAWGQVATIIITTIFLFVVDHQYWFVIVFFWALVPAIAFFMFRVAPFPPTPHHTEVVKMKDMIFHPIFILCMLSIFLGAGTEVTLNQWSSTFVEKALNLPKIVGDLIGMCGFAVMLGLGRLLHGKFAEHFNINKLLISGSILSFICYLTAALSSVTFVTLIGIAVCGFGASLLWPGTLVISADRFPKAGAWMFAILAAAGDIGAAFAPWLTGFVVDTLLLTGASSVQGEILESEAIRLGILVAAVFPLLAIVIHVMLLKLKRR